MPIAAEGFVGLLALRIAAGVTGIGRMSNSLTGLQAELKTGTESVERAAARLDNHARRWSGIAGRHVAPHAPVHPAGTDIRGRVAEARGS